MLYKILILRCAQKELSSLSIKNYYRTKAAIQKLSSNPQPRGCKKLVGREGYRIRAGEYRIIYEIDNNKRVITILHVGHRRDIYR